MILVLSRRDASELALSIWNDGRRIEMPRLERIDDAMKTGPMLRPGATAKGAFQSGAWKPTVIIPPDAPDTMWELAAKAPTNYLPLLVNIYRQALRVEGYLPTGDQGENPWRWWQANRMDARQSGIHQSALKYGVGYAMVVPGVSETGMEGPTVRAFTPRRMTAIYQDPEVDEWPIAAVYVDGPNNEHMVLVDEEGFYRFSLGGPIIPGVGFASRMVASLDSHQVDYLGPTPHNAGLDRTPIIRYRDAFLLEGEEQYGIVEPVMVIQERIDETNFEQLVAQFFTAFRQRIILGWVPSTEAEQMKANAAAAWYLDVNPDDVSIQEIGGADPGKYSDAQRSAVRAFAASSQLPSQDFGVDAISNVSDATLAGLNASKNNRAGDIALALGEAHEQLMRTMAFLAGNLAAAQDYEGEVRWTEREPRTWGATIDGLVKLVQSQILTPDTVIEMVPGMTDHQVELARRDSQVARASANVAALRESALARQQRQGQAVNLPDAAE